MICFIQFLGICLENFLILFILFYIKVYICRHLYFERIILKKMLREIYILTKIYSIPIVHRIFPLNKEKFCGNERTSLLYFSLRSKNNVIRRVRSPRERESETGEWNAPGKSCDPGTRSIPSSRRHGA